MSDLNMEQKPWEQLSELIETDDPKLINDYELIKSETPDQSHALFLAKTDDKGQISWWSGYGWERAGEIKNTLQWEKYLTDFANKQ